MSSTRKNQRAVDVYRRMRDTQRLIDDELRSRGLEPHPVTNTYQTPTTLEDVVDADIIDISWEARERRLPSAPIQVNYINPPPAEQKKTPPEDDFLVFVFFAAFFGVGGFFALVGIVSTLARMFRGW